ncbi:MAG: Hydroxypyruvate isomerase [Pedosphaera sp.]|nr:Hydroxypyruvate isomerase [Pedosphaera sp.]
MAAEDAPVPVLKGRINHSVCRWCYDKLSLEELCKASKEMGLKSIDLLSVDEFATVKKYDMVCAMVQGVPGGIGSGFNRLENHDKMVAFYEETMPKVAEAGFPNMICFSGYRNKMDDAQGMENCVTGLKRVAGLAEKHKVTLCMELLNSKIDHHDYMCDRTAWGVEVCKKVGSERVKLLYDIYHMQIMEGDVIRTIKQNHQYIGHFHTGGVPDRHEIDDSQELYYPAIMRAIVATGYKGYVAQEFLPKGKNALEALKKCVAICDV